jgi:N-succinyldiaminopimelate aminotransferase
LLSDFARMTGMQTTLAMKAALSSLQPYPFEKLAALLAGVEPPSGVRPIVMSVGEPKHDVPEFIARAVQENIAGLANYPPIAGGAELRQAIAGWLVRRFHLAEQDMSADRHVLPVSGTREGLFAIAQCVVEPGAGGLVLMPNPCYQVYEGAALLAGADPWYVNASADTGFAPDFAGVPDDVWRRCRLLYVTSPGNPTGTVLDAAALEQLLHLSSKYDFVIAADECYSEIYPDENRPPPGLLGVAAACGQRGFRNCLVFHSLSKRSSVPGMRSGFVAGDAGIIEKFRRYRTYHGCSMAPPFQAASVAAWSDEEHVRRNRSLYREKFAAVLDILGKCTQVEAPDGGFYLWLKVPGDDQNFARSLLARYNLVVLPGSFMARTAGGSNPGYGYVRVALVPPLQDCREGAERLARFMLEYKANE